MGDVANFSKGTGYSKSDLKGTGSPIILYGRLYTKYETIIRNVDSFVVPKSGSVFSKGGEVIVPGSGETAEDISIASVVEPAGILLGGDLNIIYPNSDLDPTFLAITISNGKPHFDMARRAQGKSIVHLHNADLKHISLKTPNLSEQKRISKIFEVLDQTITLHEKKKRQLERLKSALLQKIFADKSGYPAVRFEGFDKAWKQSKLGEITKVIAAKPYISTPSTHGNYLVIQQGDKPIAGFSNSKPFKNYNNITLFGDHTLSLFKPRSSFLIASDGIKILSPSIEMNGLFYFYALEKYKPKSEGYKRHFTILKKCKANFPTNIDEQKLIGNLLLRIDNLINKRQLKIDKLNEIKESLLQKMFI